MIKSRTNVTIVTRHTTEVLEEHTPAARRNETAPAATSTGRLDIETAKQNGGPWAELAIGGR